MIRETLIDRSQYITTNEMMTDGFRDRIERQLWSAGSKDVAWSQIRTEAAQQAGFVMHHPGKLDDVRDLAVRQGHWRLADNGRFVERGPFDKPKARVAPPQVIGKPDPKTGAVTLKVDAVNADQVKFISRDGKETSVQGGQITIDDLSGTFIAIDSTGEHESAEPLAWQNTITIRHEQFQDGNVRRVRLEAVPKASIRYTTDGMSPLNAGTPYTGPFVIANDEVKILAIAESAGVRSKQEQFTIPAVSGGGVTVDQVKPAAWNASLETSSTAETFNLLALLEKYQATVHVASLTAEHTVSYSSWTTDAGTMLTVQEVREVADLLTTLHSGWTLRIEIDRAAFPSGADLLGLVRERQATIQPHELEQQ